MCAPAGAADDLEYYSSHTKCCTFLPQLTNFLVGAMIAQQPAHIEPSAVQIRTPFGMIARPGHQARFDAMVAAGNFGRDPALRCPYYVEASGKCGIWHAREAQCSTWFCKLEHGPRGRALWDAVLAMFRFIEAALARWCVAERGLDMRIAGCDSAAAWGHWWGREAEFYRDCAVAVDALDAAALARLLPDTHLDFRDIVIRAHAQLDDQLDDPLRLPIAGEG